MTIPNVLIAMPRTREIRGVDRPRISADRFHAEPADSHQRHQKRLTHRPAPASAIKATVSACRVH